MEKKKLFFVIGGVIAFLVLFVGMFFLYRYIRVKTAKVEVILKDDLTLEFFEKKKVSDFIESINGEILDDYVIDSTSQIGKQKVSFSFRNEDRIKVPYSYEITVVDNTPPLIWLNQTYRVALNQEVDLEEDILCGDNYDANPKCYIEGEYDLTKVGKYPLTYRAIDSSGNSSSKKFTLEVYEPKPSSGGEVTTRARTDFQTIVETHKTEHTKIGLDISKWQEDVDFSKVKQAGAEFIMIRVGTRQGKNGEIVLDPKFEQNIKGALREGLEVGVYFYSYASSMKDAKQEAEWVLKQIKDYDVTLPVVFDWEEWQRFNQYHLSFYGLTQVAETFLSTVEKAGYEGMLYSSRTYLENMWFPTDYDIWLAHYTKKTNYQGKYRMWQLCNNGKIDGISGDVDIDVLYY